MRVKVFVADETRVRFCRAPRLTSYEVAERAGVAVDPYYICDKHGL